MSMMGILQVASYIYKRYMDDFGVRIDEMKLHKLLYFTQRECLIQKGEPMFEAHFEAWKYGPVMVQIRQYYKNDSFYSTRNNNVAEALLNEAYQEDESGVVAYYVVKEGQILTRIFQICLGYEDTNDWLMI